MIWCWGWRLTTRASRLQLMGSHLCCQANRTKPLKGGFQVKYNFETKSLVQRFLLLELRLMTMLLDLELGLRPVEELRLHQLLLYLQEDLQKLDLQLHQGKLSLGESIRIISTWVQLRLLTLCRKLHVSEDSE